MVLLVFFLSLVFAQPTYKTGVFTFDILTPSAETIPYLPGEFGTNILTPTLTAEIVSPGLQISSGLCVQENYTAGQYSGKIVLERHGGCGTTTRVTTAQFVGASLAILYGCEPGTCPSSANHVFADSPDTSISIPIIMIDYEDGVKLLNILLQNITITASIEGTGAIVSEDRDALQAFARALPLGNPPYLHSPRYSSGLRSWMDLLNSTTIGDPCLDRVLGIWCIGGRVVELYSSDLNIQGQIPSDIGRLTALKSIQFPKPTSASIIRIIQGTIPCTLGNLTNLLELRLPSNHISTLIDDPICWPATLRAIDLSGNRITSLPSFFQNLTALKIAQFSENLITNYIHFHKSVEILELGLNRMVGTIKDFSTFSNLTSLSLRSNFLTASDIRFFWNNLRYLSTFDISTNNFTGSAPFFSNTKNLTSMDISHNRFTGALPAAWDMPKLKTLIYAHNSITSFYPAVATAVNLLEFDGGYNVYNLSTPFIVVLLFKSEILRVNLEHNLLSGVWPGNVVTRTSLQSLKLGSNQITELPSSLFTDFPNLQLVDFSNNRLSGKIPSEAPGRALLSAKFNGNPDLGDGTWPSYVTQDKTKYIKLNVSDFVLCPVLVGTFTDLVLEIEPTYYNYTGCICEPGTFGVAPNCSHIPFSTPIDSKETFSDSLFGNQRLQQGVFTVWPVSRQENPHSVKVVEFGLFVNRSEFTDFQDVITIYEGDADLKGMRVFQLRGTDTETDLRPGDTMVNSSYYRIQVFSPMATLNFQSRDAEGTHFLASVDFAETCPTGFSELLGHQCRQVVEYESEIYIEIVIYIFMGLGLLFMVITFVVVIVNVKMLIIRASSPLFCVLTLCGLAILTIAPITYIKAPHEAFVCHTRVWLTALPIVIILSNLLVKVDRIRNIFSTEVFANLQKKYRKFTNERLLATSGIMILVEIILLIVFSALQLSTPGIAEGPGTDATTLVHLHICEESTGYRIWLAIQLSYICGFILWGAYLAFLTKDTPTAFNESTHILGALMVLVFLGIILIPLNFMISSDPASLLLIRGIGQTFGAFVLTFVLFAPKLYYLFAGRGNDKNMLQNSTQKDSRNGGANNIQLSPTPAAATAGGVEILPSVVRIESSVRERIDSDLRDTSLDVSSGGTVTPPPSEHTGFLEKTPAIQEEHEEGHEDMEVV